MTNDQKFSELGKLTPPQPSDAAKRAAMHAAMQAFDQADAKKTSEQTQGSGFIRRLSSIATQLWSETMEKKFLLSTSALGGLLILPIAGYLTWNMMHDPRMLTGDQTQDETTISQPPLAAAQQQPAEPVVPSRPVVEPLAKPAPAERRVAAPQTAKQQSAPVMKEQAAAGAPAVVSQPSSATVDLAQDRTAVPAAEPVPPALNQGYARMDAEGSAPPQPSRDRVAQFETNPVKRVADDPVSTFSIDVDTASYAMVRRSLKDGVLPDPDSIRVEEMINYFPYDWKGPDNRDTPFNATITVTPTPWNQNTKLMHIGIKGYDVIPAEKPRANLVFLLDVSGSMNKPDKLPLLKSAFHMLVSKLDPKDTVSIVTYAGNAGTVLEPTEVKDKAKIFDALNRLEAGGSTAGEAGIKEAYRLAKANFVKDGVNRVMLATDGDFNVGQSSDEELKKLIEDERKSGVFLSVFGFGEGNYNDQMMQILAQNGNGTAAYIDTLAEAEKTLVQEATSTLFPIAKDVKIQVEFNPAAVAEYRLIGYETRALKREDFNNDRIDAGEIGSGHTVTAIYEITPKNSPAVLTDDLRYGKPDAAASDAKTGSDEYAFFKIRYKLPNEDTSKLITTPVTKANEIADAVSASSDVRFSTAVAAFGQKLRGTDSLANYSYADIAKLGAGSRGDDAFGYRSEFLSLVRLADALEGKK
ncbi:vWA domain-containing protein [Phyllobacterium myrsinacearum]|uniref:Ca-activated chloride channel family protein n=1 Tax=Phyllobacterium myrsinacearum TaxID=28101 RepID=A0A839EIH3_9HYPH|nr:VWA domain-containing protein [Phyllobacterium myrsinacearum]MBA8878589.1 Ca-activated chloride channel family protein [Phyllobacterium myrsinacearum]